MKRMGWIWMGVIATLSVTALAGLAASATAAKGPDVAKLSQKAAKFAARGKVGLKADVENPFNNLPGVMAFKDEVTGDEYVWDSKGDFIRRYARMSGYAGRPGAESELSKNDVVRLAESVARDCYAGTSIDGMRMMWDRKVEAKNTERRVEYTVTFTRFAGDVPTFDSIAVQIDACTGDVMSVEQQAGPITVSAVPDVSKQQAVDTAVSETGAPKSRCKDPRLQIVRTGSGEQMLIWIVDIHTGDAQTGGDATVVIDAHSGTVVDSGASW
jgi:hypothetical protein